MNGVERLHFVSERPGRSNTDDNNTVQARSRYTTRCEGESGTVRVRRQTPCERIMILVVWMTVYRDLDAKHVELVEVTKHTVNGVPPASERKPVVYRLVWTQSYSPVRRKHWVYICICISCVSRECEYPLYLSLFHVHLENVNIHLSLFHVHPENERVYSLRVSLENDCVYSYTYAYASHVYLENVNIHYICLYFMCI